MAREQLAKGGFPRKHRVLSFHTTPSTVWERKGGHRSKGHSSKVLELALAFLLVIALEESTVSSSKWTPDMRVPPTPTPPKAPWQRRRFASDDDSSADLPRRPGLVDSDMDDRTDEAITGQWGTVQDGGDPMMMDTPQSLPVGRLHRRAGEIRGEASKPRHKPARRAEPMVRKLQFDDSPGSERHPARSTSGQPRSPVSPVPFAGKDDEESFVTPGGATKTASVTRSPDRVNTFATSPRSPIPPGSAGVGSMTRRLSHATSFARDFFDVEEIGSGEHGKVYKCVRRMDLWPYAVKVLQRGVVGPHDREEVLQEIYALASQGENPHAVRYFNAWEEDDVVYIQTELCQRTVAAEWRAAKPLSESRVWDILAQVASGLQLMHQRGVAHLDVKPSNMYVAMSGLIKLGDFGHATEATGGATDGVAVGDRRYVSREVLEGDEEADLCRADMFALGASLLELVSNARLPKSGAAYQAIRNGKLPAPEPKSSPRLLAVISQLMHPEPDQRPTASDLVNSEDVAKLLSPPAKSALRTQPSVAEDRRLLQSSLDKALQWGKEQEQKANKLQKEVEELRRQLGQPTRRGRG